MVRQQGYPLPEALTVEPTRLDDSLVRQVDGTVDEGDRSRDARYNSAVKYLASAEDTPTVILLVSEDGMINLLPDRPPAPGCAERI